MRHATRYLFAFIFLLGLLLLPGNPPQIQAAQPANAPTAPKGPGWHHVTLTEWVSPAKAREAAVARSATAMTQAQIAGLPDTAAKVTPEIKALARALNHDPMLIFDYVHNHIDYLPIYGTLNGAAGTLLAGRGTDADQSALFIALMTAAGYEATYVIGDATYSVDRLANWVGVQTTQAGNVFANGGIPIDSAMGGYQITRIWAEVEIHGETYIFDPAMKAYAETDGITNLGGALGYDRAAFLNRAAHGATTGEDSIADVNKANVRADLADYAMNLVDYIDTNLPDGGIAHVIGGREIVQSEMTAYATSLPYALSVANVSRLNDLAGYRHTLHIEHEGIDFTFGTFQLADQRLTIFYDETNGNKPVLRVGGTPVRTGTATVNGATYAMTVTVDHPYNHRDQTAQFNLKSGGAYALLHDFNTVSADVLAASNARLTASRHDGGVESSEAVLGETLSLMGWTWLHNVHLFSELVGRVGAVVPLTHHEVGIMGQEEGVFIDVPMGMVSNVSTDGVSDIWAAFRAQTMMGSAFEHGVIEQLQGASAASTIKMLTLNNANGGRTFLTDRDNWDVVEPQVQGYSAGQLAQIEASVNQTHTVVLPERGDIILNQWQGTGYIDDYQEGNQGSMGMIISGGYYGGYSGDAGDVDSGQVQNETADNNPPPDQQEGVETPEDTDPVDMTTGAFHNTHVDLAVGLDALLGLRFVRTYNSGDNYSPGPLGYGWSHTYDIHLSATSDSAAGLGARGPKDAAAMIASAHAALDLLAGDRSIETWMATTLATKWAMDQLIENSVIVHTGGSVLQFIRLPDGSFAPPPGMDRALKRVGDTYALQGNENDALFFDGNGKVQTWRDANGAALTFAYDGDGVLQSVATGNGMTLTLAYSGGHLTSVADQTGRSVGYTYTGGELIAFEDAENNAWTYAYDDAHRLTSVTRPEGNTAVANAYDVQGRVITQTDALGQATTLDFGRLRSALTLPGGDRIAYALDRAGRMTSREDADGRRFIFNYDVQGRFAGLTDRLGVEVTLTRDAGERRHTLTNAAGATMTYTYAAQTYTLTHPITPTEQVVFTRDLPDTIQHPDGGSESFAYDSNGTLIEHVDRAGHTWTFTYNDRGQVTETVNPEGGAITHTYHTTGALASTTDGDVGVTRYAYDPALRLREIIYPSTTLRTSTDANATTITYDGNGRITALTDGRNQTYTYIYDGNGNVTAIIDPLDHQETYTYDLMDRRVTRTDRGGNVTAYAYDAQGRLASVADPNLNTVQFGYGVEGRLNEITDPAGGVWQQGYNAEGALAHRTTPLGFTEQRAYTALGDLSARTDPLGNSATFTRDSERRLAAFTDPLGRQTTYNYDDQGRLVGVTQHRLGVTQHRLGVTQHRLGVTQPVIGAATYAYTALGRLARVTDLNGEPWAFEYTALGRLKQFIDPLNHVWAYTLNARGFIDQIAYPDGATETRTYDANGNLTRRQYGDGLDLHFTYDAIGRLTGGDGITLTYNALGQIVNTRSRDADFGATYDTAGRLETVTYPYAGLGQSDIFTVTYGWDVRGNLTQVSDDATSTTLDFGYDADNNLTHITRTNGVDAALTWDAAARLTRLQEGALADMQYTYNGAGEITQATLALPLNPADYLESADDAFAYDAASQVATPGYAYDEQGRLTRMPDDNASLAFTWDTASRLTRYGAVAMGYNGFGNPITRTAEGQTTGYFYNYAISARALVAERDETGDRWQRFYVLTPQGELLYAIDAVSGDVYFYHFDREGNTLFLTDADGNLTDAYAYTPYGVQVHHQGSSAQPFTFGGAYQARHERDTLYQMGARFYDAQTGHFISREPLWPTINQPKALNPYQYAFANPLKYHDPTGLAGSAQNLRLKTYQASPKEYMEWRMTQAPDVLDQKAADAVMDDYRSYAAEWSRRNEGDPSNYEPTPEEYAEALMTQAPSVMNQEDASAMAEELNRYTADWVRRNHGDPDERAANYGLSPKEYAEWQMLNAPPLMGSDEVSQLEQQISHYASEWARRNVGDPANYEMTPEEYVQWRILKAPSIMDRNAVEDFNEDVEAYAQEWARRHLGEGEAEGKAGQMHRVH